MKQSNSKNSSQEISSQNEQLVRHLRTNRHLVIKRGGGRNNKIVTPIPRDSRAYPGLVIEILNSSAEATADEEECLDLSVNSLETECKKMKLSESFSSFETVESGQYPTLS